MQQADFFRSLLRLQPGEHIEYQADGERGSVTKLHNPTGNMDLYFVKVGSGSGRRINGWGRVTAFLGHRINNSTSFQVNDGVSQFTVQGFSPMDRKIQGYSIQA